MTNLRTATSADAVLLLTIPGLFDTPVRIQGHAPDEMWSLDPKKIAETRMGADGFLTGGRTPAPSILKITVEADSLSQDFFDQWNAQQVAFGDLYYASGIIEYPATGKTYTATKGILQTYPDGPSAKKTLQATQYEVVFESIVSARS